MRKNSLKLFIFIVFLLALSFSFTVRAAIDAPHNESNNVSCGSCHGQGLLQSPFWGGSMSYDQLCLYCHTESSCPGQEYPEITGPLVRTHEDANENKLAECRTCHNPHYQKQKNYKNTDAGELYLAWGEIQCPSPADVSCPYDTENNTTTLTYSDITYKSGWDVTKLREKTDPCRRTILFPNVGKLGYSYLVETIDEIAHTITVSGDARPVYQYMSSSTFAFIYGQYIKDSINGRQVKFFDQEGNNSYADGDSIYNGVCEVCHTLTAHHRNNASGDHTHYAAINCISCHSHIEGSVHDGAHADCDSCHSHDGGAGSYYRHEPVMDYVPQESGIYDTVYSQLVESDCRSCHGSNLADRHQALGFECDQCHEPENVITDCLTAGCHSWDDVNTNGWHHNTEVSDAGNCRACHNQNLLAQNTPVGCITEDDIIVLDMIPTPFVCQNCHWQQTVTVGGHPSPDESGEPYGKAIQSSQDTHHMGFQGNVAAKCYVCHSCSDSWDNVSWNPCEPNLIRACEKCHSKEILHAIHEFPIPNISGWEAVGFHVPPSNEDQTDLEPDTYRLFTADEVCRACHSSAFWRGPICSE